MGLLEAHRGQRMPAEGSVGVVVSRMTGEMYWADKVREERRLDPTAVAVKE